MDRDWNPNVEMSPSCPRCGSSHTKFCYYNNYSLTQPRYFCKGCRRYWTKGGSIRNVPIGGGCRKNRRANNKSLRLSSNAGIVHSRSLDDLVTKQLYEYDYNHNHLSSSSSHIDLAVVFANFLNPKPDPKHAEFDEIPADLPLEFDPLGLEFANVEEANILFSNSDGGLPPLPGDGHLEAVSGDILWPDDDDHCFQMVPQPLIEPESHEDPDHLLFGNWSPFQFSR